MTWLTIPNIQVQGANANSGMFAVGYPAITAFSGFSKSFLRSVAAHFGTNIPVLDGFAVIHHTGRARLYGRYHDKMTERRYVHDRANTPSKSGHWLNPPSEIQPQGDLTFSIAIGCSLDPKIQAHLVEYPDLLDALIGPRALSGTVARCGTGVWSDTLSEALIAAPSGWVIVDETASLACDDGRDALDVMLDQLSFPWRVSGERPVFRRLFPSQIGFRAVSPLTHRAGQRDADTDHAFAEPVIGLAEWRRRHDVLNDKALLEKSRWSPRIDRAAGLFTIQGDHHG
ncbi:MAG: type I-F CRISPR-associated protein Csy2 [Alphaproteobacteria bacterium]